MPKKADSQTNNKVASNLETPVYSIDGQVVEKMKLPQEVFAVKANAALIAQSVRVYLANQRLGTHDAKTRSEVAGSTRKIYRQKGTGRARHGDIKAPTFIGGGIAHGPNPRDYSLDMPKKMRVLALYGALSDKLQNGNLKVISGLDNIEPKTKIIVEALKKLKLENKNKNAAKVLLVVPEYMKNIHMAGRNVDFLSIDMVRNLFAYEVLNNRYIVFLKSSIEALTRTISDKKEKPVTKKPNKVEANVKTATAKAKATIAKRTVKSAKRVVNKRINK